MAFLHDVILYSLPHAYTILVLLTVLLGEEIVLLFVILAAQEFVSLTTVLIVGLGSTLALDIILFYLARDLMHERISRLKKVINVSKDVRKFAHKIHTQNLLLVLTLRRFLVGTRHATTLYLGVKKMSWSKFMFYNTSSLIIWSALMVPIAWLAGRGFTILLKVATRVEKLVAFAILFILLVIIIEKIFSKIAYKPN